MSIKDKRFKDNFIQRVETKGDIYQVTHASDVDPYLKSAKAQRKANWYENDGYNADHSMRKIASIPPLMVQKLLRDDPTIFERPKDLLKKVKAWRAKGLDFTTVDKI